MVSTVLNKFNGKLLVVHVYHSNFFTEGLVLYTGELKRMQIELVRSILTQIAQIMTN